MSRGYRNNNPGNIRISSQNWQGKITPSQDTAFEQFESMAYGFRAMFKLLYTYSTRYGCMTTIELISRYAPPSENRTDKYIAFVTKQSNVIPNSTVDPRNREVMLPIVTAMAHYENGAAPNKKDVEEGWRLYVNA